MNNFSPREDATILLDFARRYPDDVETYLGLMRSIIINNRLSYADISATAQAEITKLRAPGYISRAKQALDNAVRFEINRLGFINDMEDCLKNAEASYEDIGTSADEVGRLKAEGYKTEAKLWLSFARNPKGEGKADTSLNCVDEFLQGAGASYADIGTSADEINKLRIEGYKAEAKRWLSLTRDSHGDIGANLQHMDEYLQKAGATYADIGTSESEIAQLRAQASS